MSRALGACAAILVVVTAVLTPALARHTIARHLPAGHAAGRATSSRTAPAGADAAGADTAGGAAIRPGYPDIPAALPGSAAAARAQAVPAVANITSVGSLNWSGYAVNRSKTIFTSVRATYFVPYLNCRQSPGTTRSSFWVGLDGYVGHPDSVEQIGIGADCSSASKASYFAWFEMFPYAQTTIALKVHGGDSVTAAVTWVAAKKDFRLQLHDNTRGGSFSRLRKCPAVQVNGKAVRCPRTSAEIIAEAPASGTSSHLVLDKLSDYGAVSFSGVTITDSAGKHGGIVSPHWNATRIIELRQSGGPTLAEPTSVHVDLFDSYWQREA